MYNMFVYFKKCKTIIQTHTKKICTVYGKGTVNDRICQKWFTKKNDT